MRVNPQTLRAWVMARPGAIAVVLVHAGLALATWGVVPLWDAQWFITQCFDQVFAGPFALEALVCSGHPSLVPSFLHGLAQVLGEGSSDAHLVVNVGLAALAILAFHALAARTLGKDERAVETTLVTAAFALNPTFLAATVHTNVDFPVVVFLVLALQALADAHIWRAVAFGTLLTFSKESGALCWGFLALAFGIVRPVPLPPKHASFLRLWPLAVPVMLFVAYLVWRRATGGAVLHLSAGGVLQAFLTFSPWASHFQAYMATAFVINFQWLMTALLAAWLLRATTLHAYGRSHAFGDAGRWTLLLVALIGLFAWGLTRVSYYNNPRYYLPILPALVLATAAAAQHLGLTPRWRTAFWAVCVAAALASVHRTVDPVARLMFGTFPFGRHELLAMTSRTDECCGHGRDQLAYNLEYLRLSGLLFQAVDAIGPRTVYFIRASELFMLRQWWREAGFEIGPRFAPIAMLTVKGMRPKELWTLDFPNVANGRAKESDELMKVYEATETRSFEDRGYVLGATKWVRR